MPPFWLVTGVFRGEEVPEPADGVETFEPWIVIHVDTDRPANDNGKPVGKLCPLNEYKLKSTTNINSAERLGALRSSHRLAD